MIALTVTSMRKIYLQTADVRIGNEMTCPECGSIIRKKTYQHKFCGKICKDRYWNNIDPRKKNWKHKRSHYTKYNVEAKSFANRLGDPLAKRRGYPSHAEMLDSLALEDGSWDAHGGVTVEPCDRCGMMYQYCECPDIID